MSVLSLRIIRVFFTTRIVMTSSRSTSWICLPLLVDVEREFIAVSVEGFYPCEDSYNKTNMMLYLHVITTLARDLWVWFSLLKSCFIASFYSTLTVYISIPFAKKIISCWYCVVARVLLVVIIIVIHWLPALSGLGNCEADLQLIF